METIEAIAQKAAWASIGMGSLSGSVKNEALAAIAEGLARRQEQIVSANRADLERAEEDGTSAVLIKRLRFDSGKIKDAIAGIKSLIELPEPVGVTLDCTELDAGLELYKTSCPIGLLGIVFESRPDALVQIGALALKSGNALLLKGGSEAAETNKVLADTIIEATVGEYLPEGWLSLLETREDIKAMLGLDEYIDLVIPRGSNEFVKYIMNNTRIPVLGHADGICHVYIDGEAELEKAVRIAFDSKCQYPAVCNAMETLLVDEAIGGRFLPLVQGEYVKAGVELRGDEATRKIIDCEAATDEDWQTEYNDLVLSVKVVGGLDEAIEHINRFGSRHTDAIVTENADKARRFLDLVDSANVFWNCSTRFSDGYRYGLGAEVGISTNKIHARGPVGLEGLLTYKWKMIGSGQTVAEYCGPEGKKFTHRKPAQKLEY